LPEAYTINYIGLNMIGTPWFMAANRKGEPGYAAIARYLAGAIFLIFGLSGKDSLSFSMSRAADCGPDRSQGRPIVQSGPLFGAPDAKLIPQLR
jgi:hypothetical protein